MAGKEGKSDRTLWMLGAVMTLPMILASGPIAGYVISRYILVKYLGASETFVPVLVGLGFFASSLQAYRLIQRIKQLDTNKG